LSAAKTALTIAVRYGEARRQFKPPGGGEEDEVAGGVGYNDLLRTCEHNRIARLDFYAAD
jgi:hypothetical protein